MKTRSIIILLLILFVQYANSIGQSYTAEEKLQGYSITNDEVTFIFDPSIYGIDPEFVTVTGSFRNWDQTMDHPEWKLSHKGEIWILKIDNQDFTKISPNHEFKFRVDGGSWLDPPKDALNTKSGNLVFMMGVLTKSLKAEIRNTQTIWAHIIGARSLDPKDYKLVDATGKEIEIAEVLPNTATETLILTAETMDIRRVYFLEIPSLNLRSFCSFDGWFRTLYSSKELGANINNNQTTIRLFAPRAELVKVYLYKNRTDQKEILEAGMKQDSDGVWEIEFLENYNGYYYDFTIHGSQDPGNHFYETEPVHVTDPYARVSDNTWGKCRIWEKTKPATPLKNGIPKMQDVIAYEVHVQDFTDRLPVEDKYKGTFKAMITRGLKNSNGAQIGFDYLLHLGINTVHLMPVQEYLHYPDDDWKASFEHDDYMIDQGVANENYQWGYRTSHFFAVESKYRTKGEEPGKEREEFRDLVQAFHDQGLAVIIDIVPNHTAENMDAEQQLFNFNAIDKMYYYRTKDFDHIGAFGNEVKTENRPMVQRWLIDQCKHYIEEFGIDGFRIDLAGQIDEQTLIKLKDAIGHDKIVYGEAWIGSNDPAYEDNPDWDWYKEDAPITFFQDDTRNAFKGSVFELNDKLKDRGWSGGKFDERENVMKALTTTFPEDKSPLSGINYLDIHDNFALADQFGTRDFDGRNAVDQDLYKIAVTLLYTSLGPIVTHGGSEIMRSKGHAPLMEVLKETKAGFKIYMHGKRDTYNHRTANQFIWETVGQTPSPNNSNDYKNMHAFWQGLNKLRMSQIGKVFRVSEKVPEDYYEWILPADESLLGYIVDNKIMVLLNAGSSPGNFNDIKMPIGKWELIADNRTIDHTQSLKDNKDIRKLKGNQEVDIILPKQSLRIWVNRK